MKSASQNLFRKPRFKVFFLLVLIVSAILYLRITSGEILITHIKNRQILGQLKKIGLVKATVPGYFKALNTQNLFYDYNSDGVVDGIDYIAVLKDTGTDKPEVKGISTSDMQPLAATGESEAAPQQLPSVKGFGSNEFNGESTISYGIEVPAGVAGIAPSLGVSYSSGSVDDLLIGADTKWRNDTLHPYQAQAGKLGLGWNLSGIQYIARDMKNDINDTETDGYILSFSGGAANLVKESDNGSYSVWRTLPNLKIKVERWALCKDSGGTRLICRHHWLVTTGDGTKYTFGSSQPIDNWSRPRDPEVEPIEGKPGSFPGPWYPLYDDTPQGPVATRTWMLFAHDGWRRHALETKWLLAKVESVFDTPTANLAEMNYSYRLELGTYKDQTYVATFYPDKITYGKHEVTFTTEPRLDYFIHNGEWGEAAKQSERSKERLKKISVKTLGKAVRTYVFDYVYGWNPSKHKDDGDGVAETAAEVVSGQVIHSLLTKITQFAGDLALGAKSLPAYTFYYGPNTGAFKGGAPLTSFVATGNDTQVATPHDFFLKMAGNGYGGSTTFEYWQDSQGRNALPIKYCDGDKLTQDLGICLMDHAFNTQRHRLRATVTSDGMGNTFRTEYDYSGEGASQGLAYVEKYGETEIGLRLPVSKFEFLGYPEVVTTIYEKNSSTKADAKSKSFYFQAIETDSCFRPSPLKGIAYNTITYDVTNSGRRIESQSTYKVRLGAMFGPWDGAYDRDLSTKCDAYDPDSTITAFFQEDTVTKEIFNNNPTLCTKTYTDYRLLDGNYDPYIMPHTVVNYGKVNCTDPVTDDTSDVKKMSFTDYTVADTTKWLLPKPKESWTSNSLTGTKYNHSQITYNSYGLPIKTSILANGAAHAETTTAYNTTYPWLVTKTTDPLGRSTSTTYDSVFHMYPTKVTNHLGQSASTDYDFNIADTAHPNYGGVLGVPVRITDANGEISNSVYDVFGRTTETYLPGKKPASGIKPDSFSKYYYFNEDDIAPCNDANHCLTGLGKQLNGKGPKTMVYSGSRFADDGVAGKVSATHSYYDGLGQTVQTRQLWYENEWANAGIPINGTLQDIIKSQSFNALGQPEYQSLNYTANPYIPSSQNSFDTRNFVSDANIQKVKYTYDGMGRAILVSYPDGTSEATEYDVGGNPLVTKSSNKNCTDTDPSTLCTFNQTTKDAFGQTLEVNEINDGKTYTTGFEYHPVLGSVTKTIDTNDKVINKVEYDTLSRKTKMWDADMSPTMNGDTNSWRYEYDKIGNLVKQTNPKGDVSNLSYDVLNRLLTKSVNSTLLLENIYDSCTNGVGRSCEVRSYDLITGKLLQSAKSQYDNRSRVSKSTLVLSNLPDTAINNQSFTTSLTYDLGGRLITQTRSGNDALLIPSETLTYTYGRPYLTQVSGTNSYVSDARYNKDGQMVKFISGNGVVNSYVYHPDNSRLSALSITSPILPNADEINLSYQYDPLGNITKISDNNTLSPPDSPFNLSQVFSYDALNRLKDVAGAYTASYQYDDLNNILSKTEGPATTTLSYSDYYGSFYHRPQTVTDSAGKTNRYSFDIIGNLLSDSQRSYTYDQDNRLTKLSPVDPTFKETQYYYDATGSRIAKIVKEADTTYYISPELEVIVNPNAQVGWRQNYFFAGKLVSVRENLSPACNTDGFSYAGDFYVSNPVTVTAIAKTVNQSFKVDNMIYHLERNGQQIQTSQPIPAQELVGEPGRYQTSWDLTVPEEPGKYRLFTEINCQEVLGATNTPVPTTPPVSAPVCQSWTNAWIDNCDSYDKYAGNNSACVKQSISGSAVVKFNTNVTTADQMNLAEYNLDGYCSAPEDSIGAWSGWQSVGNKDYSFSGLGNAKVDKKLCAGFRKNNGPITYCGGIIHIEPPATNLQKLSLVEIILDIIAKIFFIKTSPPVPEITPTPTKDPATLELTSPQYLKLKSFTPVVNLKLTQGEINFTVLDLK